MKKLLSAILFVPVIVLCSISFAEDSMVWHKEYVDKGGWNNIVLDNNDLPHISYYSKKDLKYATKIGTAWVIDTVDSMGDVGDYNSIKLDSEGNPHISYYDNTNDNLKYAKKDSFWVIEEVDTIGNVGRYSSLFLDSLDRPCIAYRDFTQKALKYAKKNGKNWQIQVVDTMDTTIFSSEMSYSSLSLDSYDNPHIAYVFDDHGFTLPALKYAYSDGVDWEIEVVDDYTPFPPYDMGEVTLVLDDSNKPYISYSGKAGTEDGFLMCIVRDTSGWECIFERGDMQNNATFPNSIALKHTNDTTFFHIIYSGTYWGMPPLPDHTTYLMRRISLAGSWTGSDIDSTHMYQIYPRCLVVDSLNCPHFTFGGVYYWHGEYVGIEESEELKVKSVKLKIYPNPFTGYTIIRFQIPDSINQTSETRIQIYDIAGRTVKTFNNLANQPFNQITWDGKDENGKTVKKGIYFCRLEVDNLSPQIKKIVYLR